MISRALFVRLQSRRGKDRDVEDLLNTNLPLAQDELGTAAWLTVKFGSNDYGMFAAFTDDAGREAHLAGPVGRSLRDRAPELCATRPRFERVEVMACKLPPYYGTEPASKGLLQRLTSKENKAERLEGCLRDIQSHIDDEPKTLAWFALRFGKAEYGIFGVFPDEPARLAHLEGHVPRELGRHAFSLLGGMPDPDLCDILAEKFSVPMAH